MDIEKKEEFIERIYYLLCGGYKYLYETGKQTGHWDDIRGTALAGIALDFKEPANSVWLRLIRNWLIKNQIGQGDVAGAWGEEIWDTAMCVMALKSFELSSKDPIIKTSIDWIASLYQINKRNNWHDEPWETCWALIAILTSGTIPQNIKVEEPVKWLLEFQESDGRIIAPHYTAYYLIIWDRLKKTRLSEEVSVQFEEAKDLGLGYLKNLLKDASDDTLWSGEAWANGQILWAMSCVDPTMIEDEQITERIVTWFEVTQGTLGCWSDIEDTSSAIIGLYRLLEGITNSAESLKGRGIKQTLQKRLPSPDIYIKKPFIEKHIETGGISIHLNNRLIKVLAIFGTLCAGFVTIYSLFDIIKKLL
jgi:hypothetical protein